MAPDGFWDAGGPERVVESREALVADLEEGGGGCFGREDGEGGGGCSCCAVEAMTGRPSMVAPVVHGYRVCPRR